MTPTTKAVLGVPGTLTVRGREFVVAQPLPADHARVHEKMREVAGRGCTNPVLAVNAVADQLNPGVFSETCRHAVAIVSGGGVEPTREAVIRAYDSLDGVRFRLWYYARKADPSLTQAAVNDLVDDENRYEVADDLAKAQPVPEAAGPLAPASGAS